MILELSYNRQRKANYRRIYFQNRRAIEHGYISELTIKDWLACLTWWGERCCYCDVHADDLGCSLSIDHFMPLNDPSSPGNIAANVVPACYECNRAKGGLPPGVFVLLRFGQAAPVILGRIQQYLDGLHNNDYRVTNPEAL